MGAAVAGLEFAHGFLMGCEPTQPPGHWILGALLPGLKMQGHEADHSPPSSTKIKNGGAIPPLPIHLHGIVLNYLNTGTTLPLLFSLLLY
jgi:hypothetical protein